ncbi:hypothetical protein [Streptomyces halobius]|nr:hypothetical protein [Streptomyces halobius]
MSDPDAGAGVASRLHPAGPARPASVTVTTQTRRTSAAEYR